MFSPKGASDTYFAGCFIGTCFTNRQIICIPLMVDFHVLGWRMRVFNHRHSGHFVIFTRYKLSDHSCILLKYLWYQWCICLVFTTRRLNTKRTVSRKVIWIVFHCSPYNRHLYLSPTFLRRWNSALILMARNQTVGIFLITHLFRNCFETLFQS